MDWQADWDAHFAAYLQHYRPLIGDQRTFTTFSQTIGGIIAAGSLVASRIAAHTPLLASSHYPAQRILRMVEAQSTKRSPLLDADHLTSTLRDTAISSLRQQAADEVWLIADGSDLRKPYATKMPDLMKVRNLSGQLVSGYHTLNVVAVTPQHRHILYHHLYCSNADDFISEPKEVANAISTVSAALGELPSKLAATWIMDRGFDDQSTWGQVWQQCTHLVVRLAHQERLVSYRNRKGHWEHGPLSAAVPHAQALAEVETTIPADRRQRQVKLRARLSSVPLQVSYRLSAVEGEAKPKPATKSVWLVVVEPLESMMEPWLLLTDWRVEDSEAAERIFRMYRQRWAIEEGFKFSKECLGWEEVQVLDLEGIRTLVAMAWIAAGYLYEMGVGLNDETVQLLARLGGWDGRKAHKPGKIVLSRGLQRVLSMLATEAILARHMAEYGELPPMIAQMLGRCREL